MDCSEFLGANILDTKPFIVTPYLEQGNAAEYVLKNPDCKRLDIVRINTLSLASRFSLIS